MTRVPGPGGLELLRALLGRRGNPVAMMRDIRERHGEVARIQVGPTPYILLSGIDGIKHVLLDNAKNYTKGPAYELLGSLLGRGLVTAEGDDWKRHRRVVQPSLQRDRMPAFVTVMAREAAEEAQALRQRVQGGQVLDVFPLMLDLALRIISRTLLGGEAIGREQEVHDALTEVLTHFERVSVSKVRLLELLPGGRRLRGLRTQMLRLPTARNRSFKRAIQMLDDLVYGAIAARRRNASSGEPGDLVSVLLQARDETTGQALTDAEVRDEIMTMFLAGHETVATGLAWSLHLLSRHPKYADAIAREGELALGARLPTVGDLASLVTAEHVFEESMRLFPPVWRISRMSLAPDTISGFDVPAESIVVVATVVLHRDARLWPQPDVFMPERFARDAKGGASHPRGAFIPFGTGQRMCIGAGFAMAEAQVALTALCRALRLEPVLPGDPALEPSFTLRPRGGMPIRLTPR